MLGVSPVSEMLPLVPPHVVGCVTADPPITGAGIGLITTVVVSGNDTQELLVAIAI